MERVKKELKIEFYKSMRGLSQGEYIEKQFLFSAAPVLAGVKPSALISIENAYVRTWREKRDYLISLTGLSVREVCISDKSILLLIYYYEALKENLKCPIAIELLRCRGYPENVSLSNMLSFLEKRFVCTNQCCTEKIFPHEIGIFLGYPPNDVLAFIEKGGKDYLCCRYWKVYHDEKKAKELFARIDRAKEHAISVLSLEVPLLVAAKMLTSLRAA